MRTRTREVAATSWLDHLLAADEPRGRRRRESCSTVRLGWEAIAMTFETTTQQIRQAQHAWAERQDIERRDPDHAKRLEDNLFDRRLSPEAREEFDAGAGHELGDPEHPEALPGLSALLSSAALVYNVFDYWQHRDKRLLVEACGAEPGIRELALKTPASHLAVLHPAARRERL
jgi:hypothetical protein